MILQTEPSDEAELVEQAKADTTAFGELYQRHVARIYSYVYHRTGNQSDAEDLTERVFVQALTHLRGYTYRGLPFSVWLFRIAHNVVANWHRDRLRNKTVPMDDANLTAEMGIDRLEMVEDVAQLRKAMTKLPQDRQQLLLLKFNEELSHAEIGKIMNRSEGAVKALLHRTLKALKHELQGAQVEGH